MVLTVYYKPLGYSEKYVFLSIHVFLIHVQEGHPLMDIRLGSNVRCERVRRGTLACPGIRQNAPISALIRPIGLCGTQNAKKKEIGPNRQFSDPPLLRRSLENCWSGPNFFLCVLGTTEPNWFN